MNCADLYMSVSTDRASAIGLIAKGEGASQQRRATN